MHENGCVPETHFHMNGFARRIVLTQWQDKSEMGYITFPSKVLHIFSLKKLGVALDFCV